MNYIADYWINKTTNDLTQDLKQYNVPGFGHVHLVKEFPIHHNNGTVSWGVQFNEFETHDKVFFLIHTPKDETWGVNQLIALLYPLSESRDEALIAFFTRLQDIKQTRKRNILKTSKEYLRALVKQNPDALSEEEKELIPYAA